MKIVYVTSESYLDHSYTIVKVLKERTELSVFIQAKEKTDEITDWCKELSAKFVKRKRFRNPFSFFSELGFLLSVKKIKADRIWFNTLTAYQAVIAKVLLKDFIVMVHDVEIHPETKDYYSVISLRLTLALFKRKVGVASHVQAKIFKDKYGFEPKVFQLPIIDYYTKGGRNSQQKAPVSEKIRFFFFGSVEPYKGIETLLEAAEILENKNINFEIAVYGKLKYNADGLRSRMKKIKGLKLTDEFVHYIGIHEIYCNNDVLILPYRQVTQCGPLLIGYNELVPSISSDLEGFREYVDDGKSGLLFNNTPAGLAEKMEMVIKTPGLISGMKEYIEKNISKRFSMESLGNEYINNFKN
jgi:glycosyltransferase involved in cell wall biosynthesis